MTVLAALALFTVCPVPARFAHRPPRGVVRWLPAVGVLLGALAWLAALAVWRGGPHGSALLAAVLVVAVLAAGTRGLHLDGLADLADGLGSRRPADGALEIMRRSDIGPFGVVTLLLTLLVDVAALATVLAASSRPQGLVAVLVVVVTGRVAVVLAAGARPARPDGFGALVAGSVDPLERAGWAVAAVVLAVAARALAGGGVGDVVWDAVAVAGGLGAAALLQRHAVRRLGGTSGDVFGALLECATAVTALLLAVGVTG